MKKLTLRKIRWIVGEKGRGEISTYRIAKQQNVSVQWVNALYREWLKTGEYPVLRKCGVKPRPVPILVQELVLSAFREYPVNALHLEEVLKKRYGVHVPHNTIHKILKAERLAVDQESKKKRRKWVRFERRNSNSLWQTDWTFFGGEWLMAIMDDASRLIVGYGLFSNPTAENSVKVLEQAIDKWGTPKAILTGHDTQFTPTSEENSPENHAFQQALKKHRIKHIKARVNHPQTCGKIERFFGEAKRKTHHFRDLNHFIEWYNEIKPHMSLNWDELETPFQAFRRKLPKQIKEQIEVKIREKQ